MTDRTNPGPKVAAHQDGGRGTTRVPYPVGINRGVVTRRELVTPHMLRITIAGEELRRMISHQADDHVKVLFAFPDGSRNDPAQNAELSLDWVKPIPPSRKYTLRRVDTAAGEIDLDFVVHDGGFAAEWARAVQVGDEAVVAGPPGSVVFPHTYRHYVLVADPTGLPALARWLDEADWIAARGVTVQVIVEIDHAEEAQYPLAQSAGVSVRWLPRAEGSQLDAALRELELGDIAAEDVFVFAAGEATDLKAVRRFAKERGYDALVTGYWKRGVADLDE
ncbi:siderophore-interacting protein [Nocardioides sp. Bht2]|uniref:siderophore-interacting protein n=1 Tax=Nocardioides sp. Bht2 TaxID=3392297 RepID=UPI0039B61F75